MKKKLMFAAVFVLLIAVFSGLYAFTRPEADPGHKTVTVQVIHKDSTTRHFTYETQEAYLAPVLTENGLVTGEQGPYGFYILEADGERADFALDGAYWALFVGEDYASTGADATPIHDGDQFRLVYTRG